MLISVSISLLLLSGIPRHRRHTANQQYQKLNVRFKHGTNGYMDLSYTQPMYNFLVRHIGSLPGAPHKTVSDWTVDVLTKKGFVTDEAFNKYNADQIDDEEIYFEELRPKRHTGKEESLEDVRMRRENSALLSYCCREIELSNCSTHLCFL